MWQPVIEQLNGARIQRIRVRRDSVPLTYAQVLQGWAQDRLFRAFFTGLLADAPFAAYFWETPPVTRAHSERPFECVLVDSPALASVPADRDSFAEHFAAADAGEAVVSFPSLGRDALLIAPCPRVSPQAYAHLAAFTRCAPESQQHALWQRLGTAAGERLSDQPLWISTSGLGVYWLHLRLDRYPKYYTFSPYKAVPE